MQVYRRTSHTLFDLKYHLIWTTKYRKPVLTGRVGTRVRGLVREICQTLSVQILRGHISADHVHIFISAPPQLSVSKLAQFLKGKTSRKLLQEYAHLRKKFWGQHLWGRGYYAVSSGNITDEMIHDALCRQPFISLFSFKKYIEHNAADVNVSRKKGLFLHLFTSIGMMPRYSSIQYNFGKCIRKKIFCQA